MSVMVKFSWEHKQERLLSKLPRKTHAYILIQKKFFSISFFSYFKIFLLIKKKKKVSFEAELAHILLSYSSSELFLPVGSVPILSH